MRVLWSGVMPVAGCEYLCRRLVIPVVRVLSRVSAPSSMKIHSLRHYAGLIVVLALASHIGAPLAPAQARSPSLQPSEVRFLQGLYQEVIADQRMAEMALNQGQTRGVRQLGTSVARDLRHSREDIQILARNKSVSLSSTLAAQNRHAVTRVSNAHGAAFDRTYVDTVLEQVTRTLQMSQAMAASTRDPDLQAFLNKAIPRLQRVQTEATTERARL